ncbi:lytic transglycosylase domain-containing protein [Oryzomonas sagensis]|uniref:Lytic transglycosylase domain-containing protein n=1 Tax=Oryzomonas sagensis TaxID=2603857 RepID=A0ABQ6TTH0_9BACT|nr:lytic transglycosylase domain-containing protein [Oryzomonas sagensis]KAB0672293.1 lytic transglycosylase domain-containing protein [Oryzomonas sagensis]
MTIDISGNLSLLKSILAQESRKSGREDAAGQPDGVFAERLDRAMESSTAEQTQQASAQNLAEALSLQMLHTTLSLAGDGSSDATPPQTLGQQPSLLQPLIKAYADAAAQATAGQTSYRGAESSAEQPAAVYQATSSTPLGSDKEWLEPIIAKASRRYGVETGLIKAVIKAESNFNPTAVSSAGARGLMQLMPGTARSLGVNDAFDPEQNVMAGTRFLRDLLDRYNGNVDSALAAYNWGPGNVDRRPDRMPRETQNYLVRVKQLYASYSA